MMPPNLPSPAANREESCAEYDTGEEGGEAVGHIQGDQPEHGSNFRTFSQSFNEHKSNINGSHASNIYKINPP